MSQTSNSAAEFDEATAEHISLGDEFTGRAEGARTVSERAMVADKLRARATYLTFYRQGFLEVIEKRGGRSARCLPIDLRYLDATPSVDLRVPVRLLKITGVIAGIAAVFSALWYFDVLTAFTTPAMSAAIAAASMAAVGCFYLTHEEIRFYTQHGRAMTLRLTAGLGSIGRYRKLLPKIISAIEEAADEIGEDTMVYLRSEMREHYRLRGAGVLSDAECSDSTARILAHFDDPMYKQPR